MNIYTDLSTYDASASVVATGTFDGVHTGHRVLLRVVSEMAQKMGARALVCTFWPHPLAVLSPRTARLSLLSTLDEKIELFRQAGLEHLVILPFTESVARMRASEFVSELLITGLGMKALVMGKNHHLGRNREGDAALLQQLAGEMGFVLHTETLSSMGQPVSSTRIRRALEAGQVEAAAQMLGYPYFFSGRVVEGKQLGRKLGFPTANLEVEWLWKLIPLTGVYAVDIERGAEQLRGMMNIGYRPTAGSQSSQTIEVHIFDFDDNLYNETVRVSFRKRIRDEFRFDSLSALTAQLALDKAEVARFFSDNNRNN